MVYQSLQGAGEGGSRKESVPLPQVSAASIYPFYVYIYKIFFIFALIILRSLSLFRFLSIF